MYQFLAPMLLNEVKEHRRNDEQQIGLEEARQENVVLRARLERLERVVEELKREK